MSFRFSSIWVGVATALAFAACADDGDRVLEPTTPSAGAGEAGGASDPPSAGGGAGTASEGGGAGQPAAGSGEVSSGPKTVLVVLEGFRAEQLSAKQTPNLWAMAESGVRFTNHHSVLPSNRMAAAASLATGTLPGRHGVLGDRMYLPGVAGHDSQNRALETSQPIRIDDHGTLESLQRALPDGLLQSKALFEVAQAAGLRTAVIGRAGPASLFDVARQGWVLNDNYVFPREFAAKVASLDLGLPTDATALLPDLVGKSAYGTALEADVYGGNASLGAFIGTWRPAPSGSPNALLNPLLPELHAYRSARSLELAAASHVLTASATDLLVVWLRDPGETAERVGPSAEAAVDAVLNIDAALGELGRQLPEGSNLLVTSDGGVSALAGDARFFPRWGLAASSSGVVYLPSRKASAPMGALQVDTPGGVPADGAVRLVDLLTRSGFSAYDGERCLSGHAYVVYDDWKRDWKVDAQDVCPDGAVTGPALVPAQLDPRAIVVASNGASELLYLPSHRKSEVAKVVAFLQTRPEIGAIFVAPRYLKDKPEALPGTLSLALLGFSEQTLLDILVTYAWTGDDPVAFGPLMQPVPPSKPALNDACAVTPCRGGLYCDLSVPPQGACRFCPADRAREVATCNVSEAAYEQAKTASAYQQEHQSCEEWAVCAPGLSCSYGVCTKAGEPPRWTVKKPAAGHLRGSSYGAMSGVRFARSLTGNSSALRDDYFGVRGGASPAELSGFLIAVGPAFKRQTVIENPSGVVDIAPTLLHLLQPGLESKLGDIDGRLLTEALVDGGDAPSSEFVEKLSASVASSFFSPTEAESSSASLLTASGTYSSRLEGYSFDGGETLAYFTLAGATRAGLTCETSADCPDGVSCGPKGVCLVTPSCVDGVKNGAETDIDCGLGAKCRACYVGQACMNPSDCESSRCTDSVCQAL